MKVLVRVRNSHAFRLVPCWNWWNDAYAFAKVSCTRSSASDGFRVIRTAAAYSWSRWGSTSRSNRTLRWSRVSGTRPDRSGIAGDDWTLTGACRGPAAWSGRGACRCASPVIEAGMGPLSTDLPGPSDVGPPAARDAVGGPYPAVSPNRPRPYVRYRPGYGGACAGRHWSKAPA